MIKIIILAWHFFHALIAIVRILDACLMDFPKESKNIILLKTMVEKHRSRRECFAEVEEA